MRSIWNGAISFGLVSIPVKLMNATENHSISFRQIHAADGGRIRYRKVCELEEKEVPNDEIGKGYETEEGSVIPIADEDLAKLPLPTAKTIEIVAFVPGAAVDPLQIDAAYYLSANGGPAVKPYTVLREALKRSQKVALAKFALRGRERLGMLRVVDDVIAMHGLLWPDEIRSPDEVAPEGNVTVREAELDLADALMDTLGEVDMDSLHDHYREAVEEMIAAKAQGAELPAPAEGEDGGGQVIDLMAALESSVRAAKNAQGGDAGTDTGEHAEVTPIKGRKKTAASKAAAKKTTAKKTTAKTTASKTAAGKQATSGTAKKATATKAPTKTATKAAGKKATSGATKKTAAAKTAAKKTAKASPKKRASA
ncbi:Ku protein [Streptomyces sp. AM8-1-1]|uniref:non-homologous end joining protein Ku n=1 Tax=Streptomyces sp. AM8-1-1 TaxID=3075825 RepID=UPI0028C3C349|nr:Ku protein [Streptomyces sp. AM8-1-1]WNO72317.1 Ku protein [Streptomyces sp. AM8-1-1]